MKPLIFLTMLASPFAAQANYLGPNYDAHGLYIVRPPSVSTVITPQGTWTTTPTNPQHPWEGSTTVGPNGSFCTTTPNNVVHPSYGSTTICR
jgi:hypothetical protein